MVYFFPTLSKDLGNFFSINITIKTDRWMDRQTDGQSYSAYVANNYVKHGLNIAIPTYNSFYVHTFMHHAAMLHA